MSRLTMEIPLSRARFCVNCESIFDACATSTYTCPVCTGQDTASLSAWLNRIPPIGLQKAEAVAA